MTDVLSLCDYTGNMVEPWVSNGAHATIVDLQHPAGALDCGPVTIVGGDLRDLRVGRGEADIVFAFPPCTHLAVSGARWFRGKGLRALAEAIEIVAVCAELCEAVGAPYMIENPISTLATYWREPDFRFDPCDYAGYLDDPTPEAYTKRTCLWVGNGFVMPVPRRVEPTLGSKMHVLPPSPERANLRSATPKGFARAVFQANA